jgi:hypothetical protein
LILDAYRLLSVHELLHTCFFLRGFFKILVNFIATEYALEIRNRIRIQESLINADPDPHSFPEYLLLFPTRLVDPRRDFGVREVLHQLHNPPHQLHYQHHNQGLYHETELPRRRPQELQLPRQGQSIFHPLL